MTGMTTVLIVDDEPAVRDLMGRWVASLGLRVSLAASAEEALETLRTSHVDLAVIDVMMPGRNGLWLASQMQQAYPHTAVIIATGYTTLVDPEPGETPVADLLIKPFPRERFTLAVDRGRRWRKQALEELEWHARLSAELEERTDAVCTLIERCAGKPERELETLHAIARERMPETMAHCGRVARYAVSVAREMGVDRQLGDLLENAARFHDIGKAPMPESLLTKPSRLTPGEIAIMRRHVEAGTRILSATTGLREAAPVVMTSHEWFGGGGYPRKLAGAAIPLASRIIAVADAYDAMTQDRAYRVRLDSADAVSDLLRCSPTQFDPDIVDAFLAVLGRH
jgi:cyclic di-GMP phosphodiesterase